MAELAYLFIVAASGGLVGGFLTMWLTAAAVRSTEESAGNIADGYAWIGPTGHRGAATQSDVWAHFGGGPREVALGGYCLGVAAAMGAILVGINSPPPVLASGPPALWSWWSLGLVVAAAPIAFLVGVCVAAMLSEGRAGCLAILGVALPGLTLAALGITSYFQPVPWLYLAIALIGTAAVCALILARFLTQAGSYSSEGFSVLAGLYVLGVGLVAAASFWVPFSPLAVILSDSSPGMGLPGPHGEPPLAIREFAGPIAIAAAGSYADHRESRALTTHYVRLVDAAGTEVQLAVSLELEPEREFLTLGGRHPSEPWSRRPLSQAEGERFRAALKRALDEIRLNGDTLPLGQGDQRPGEPAPHLAADPAELALRRTRQLDAAREALRRLEAIVAFPLARETGVARHVVVARATQLHDAARDFRERKPFERSNQWQALRPALVSQLRANPPADLRARLIELLGEPLAEPLEKFSDGLDYSWDEPPPLDKETLVYGVGERKNYRTHVNYRIYLIFDLRPGRELDHRLQELEAPSSSSSPRSSNGATGGSTHGTATKGRNAVDGPQDEQANP